MSVIRTLSASESNEQRDREKARLEREYRKSDQRLDQLITNHDQALKDVMQVCVWVWAWMGVHVCMRVCMFADILWSNVTKCYIQYNPTQLDKNQW